MYWPLTQAGFCSVNSESDMVWTILGETSGSKIKTSLNKGKFKQSEGYFSYEMQKKNTIMTSQAA